MKKGEIIIIALTAAVLLFFLGFSCGRMSVHGYVSIFTDERAPTIGKINLNTATMDDLMHIPGISEIMAQRIIDYRTRKGYYETVEDLCNVSGISPRKLDEIRDMIYVD